MVFVSIFKINGKPILPPLITKEKSLEIAEIKTICKRKEEDLKLQKDLENKARKDDFRSRSNSNSNSYTLSSPTFPIEQLPNACYEPDNEPEIKCQIQNLIQSQKDQYLSTVNILKKEFLAQQKKLFVDIQTSLQTNTSTPLQNVSIAPTEDDEDFVEFQTCLQHSNTSDAVTTSSREKAATTINAYVRGYLVRRLLKTFYVETLIRNIQDTLQVILAFDNDRDNLVQKTKLFYQLQKDLYRFSDVFFELSIREKMTLITIDRERRTKANSIKSK